MGREIIEKINYGLQDKMNLAKEDIPYKEYPITITSEVRDDSTISITFEGKLSYCTLHYDIHVPEIMNGRIISNQFSRGIYHMQGIFEDGIEKAIKENPDDLIGVLRTFSNMKAVGHSFKINYVDCVTRSITSYLSDWEE